MGSCSFGNYSLFTMRNYLRLLGIVICMISVQLTAQTIVPPSLDYCGVHLKLTPGAKERIQEEVNKIQQSPRAFEMMAKKARLYFPFIKEAFDDQKVPLDLMYLSIQESALNGNAISMSNAVGFWQFKEPSAKEYSLLVNKDIDERRHIFRASQAASAYFVKANMDFDNWLYAVIAYYQGATGAIPHTNPLFYGADTMEIGPSFHWYVLRAIAHKLAYEGKVLEQEVDNIYLEPFETAGEVNTKFLYETFGLTENEFLAYNPWIINKKHLPENFNFTFYVPKNSSYYEGHIEDPNKNGPLITKVPTEPISDLAILTLPDTGFSDAFVTRSVSDIEELVRAEEEAQAHDDALSNANALAYEEEDISVNSLKELTGQEEKEVVLAEEKRKIDEVGEAGSGMAAQKPMTVEKEEVLLPDHVEGKSIKEDKDYNKLFIEYDGFTDLNDLATTRNISLSSLLSWNELQANLKPEAGKILYFSDPRKSLYHILEEGESLLDVAVKYGKSVKSLLKKNRLSSPAEIIPGQKIYIKKKRTEGEKITVLHKISPQIQELYLPEMSEAPIPAVVRKEQVEEAPLSEDVESSNVQAEEPVEEGEDKLSETIENSSRAFVVQSEWITHTVSGVETLWGISRMYGTKVEIIKKINNLSSNALENGQELRILARKDVLEKLQLSGQ